MNSLKHENFTIKDLYELQKYNKLTINRDYQRKLFWDSNAKVALIDSIIKRYPISNITLSKNGTNKFEIVDGMQRLDAIFDFIENEFPYDENGIKIYFDNFNDTESMNFQNYLIIASIIENSGIEESNDVFLRINSFGKSLNPQEIRQAANKSHFSRIVKELATSFRKEKTISLETKIDFDKKRNLLKYGNEFQPDISFWSCQGVFSTKEILRLDDEEFIAELILAIILGKPYISSKEQLDNCYGKGSENKLNEVEYAIDVYGAENIEKQVRQVFKEIEQIFSVSDQNFYEVVSYENSNNRDSREAFFSLFMAIYELMFSKGKELFNKKGINDSLEKFTKRLSYNLDNPSKARDENCKVCKGLIEEFYKGSTDAETISRVTVSQFISHLEVSKLEPPMFDFKQGFYKLDDSRQFDSEMPDKINRTIAALANLGKNKTGFIYIGIADKEADIKRIEDLDKISIPSEHDFGIVGLEREAKLKGVSLDQYISFIVGKIKNSLLPDWLKVQICSSILPITYRNNTVLRIQVRCGDNPVWYNNKVYYRSGSSNLYFESDEVDSIYRLFK
ncbi:DUF262 domain-containing protein [Paenibacillus sp. 2003]|uniref:GmrSD restriction endonuclease domain-containing protein n=1 Tax=Paenibacillus TaxID=44249 RepID=UPI00285B7D0B|nr:DUF262 domain-containing protein [Paenibacillus sp. 2003]MDR6718437.1 hypothetical protein [Paenibacillus sp. 2003]